MANASAHAARIPIATTTEPVRAMSACVIPVTAERTARGNLTAVASRHRPMAGWVIVLCLALWRTESRVPCIAQPATRFLGTSPLVPKGHCLLRLRAPLISTVSDPGLRVWLTAQTRSSPSPLPRAAVETPVRPLTAARWHASEGLGRASATVLQTADVITAHARTRFVNATAGTAGSSCPPGRAPSVAGPPPSSTWHS